MKLAPGKCKNLKTIPIITINEKIIEAILNVF
jgi:hypothetical protein